MLPVPATSLWQDFDETLLNPLPTEAAGISETVKYLRNNYINRTGNPLTWWKGKENDYPRLSQLAKRRLHIVVATSVSKSESEKKAEFHIQNYHKFYF